MKIVTYNIQFATGRDGKVDLDRIISEIQGADLIALQEVDRFWARSHYQDQVTQLVEAFPNYDAIYSPGVDQAAKDRFDAAGRPQRQQFGNLTLCRYPFQYCRQHTLPKYASCGPLSIQRTVLECAVEVNHLKLRVYNTHLTHISDQTRVPQVEALLRIHARAATEGPPVCGDPAGGYWQEGVQQGVPEQAIIVGDFNCGPDSREYELIAGPLSPYGGRVIHPLGFVDAWVEVGGDLDGGHTSDVEGVPTRLDYCFVGTPLRSRIKRCWVDEHASGSDHLPVWIDLNTEATDAPANR